ncbi:hypothetical protein [Streptomyces sp. SID13726]|uniref:hypothetical protein n=1 Tax=Streptomyces sp. SID13726 TaxID=2706058 RepID=UPI0013BCE9BB|nr:hypothetical protein [Streptomyces sp. SID13726]NEB01350.1 hypothetical protein [Streptomyces sp. SID13726]
MHLPTHRPRYAAAVLAVAALALTGCSAGHADAGAGSSASPGTTRTADASPRAATATSPPPRPTSLDDWPTSAAPPQKIPLGTKTTVIARGYTGQGFLDRLAADWHLTLGKRKKLTSSDPAWVVGGEGHPTKGSELSVGLITTLSGDLRSFSCQATANAPRYEEFLRACAGLDYPGSAPKAAATWLTGMKPRVDKAFAEEKVKVPVTSPLLRSGGTGTYLRKGSYSPAGTYELHVFGAADK